MFFSETESCLERGSARWRGKGSSIAERRTYRPGAHFTRSDRCQRRERHTGREREFKLNARQYRRRGTLLAGSRSKAKTALISHNSGMIANGRGIGLYSTIPFVGRARTGGLCLSTAGLRSLCRHPLPVTGDAGGSVTDKHTDHQNQPEPDMQLCAIRRLHVALSCRSRLCSRTEGFTHRYVIYG